MKITVVFRTRVRPFLSESFVKKSRIFFIAETSKAADYENSTFDLDLNKSIH